MPRAILRLLLLVYFAMPLVAGLLVVLTFAQIRSDIAPVFETANVAISNATTALSTELHNLGDNFAPLASAVNALRSGLQAVLNFIRGTIYTLIDVVNGINVACSIGRTACIPKSFNIQLPQLIDLSFIDEITASVNDISTQVNTVVTTTTTAIGTYTTMITLALIVFIAWIVLTYILFFLLLYTGLWQRT